MEVTACRQACTLSIQAILILISCVALTSFNRRAYHVVHIGAYVLNNLRLGQDLGLEIGLGSGLRCG